MIKIDLITGFLGAGKTTFIKKYADYLISRGEKVHIIENDFGGLPIDARALTEEHLDVSQITGGCMCCTGRVSFQALLLQAAEAGYDRVLVEPSGIYDVNSFFNIIQEPSMGSACSIGNIITVVDSKADDILSNEAHALMYSQLIFAGCIVCSKTQLRKPGEVDAALDSLQELLDQYDSGRNLRDEQICFTKPWDELTDEDFAQISSCGFHSSPYTYNAMDHMSIFSTTIIAAKFDTMEHLQAILEEILCTEKYGKVYRIKGYIADLEKNWYELNCSASGCFITRSNVKRGFFIVIGQNYDTAAIEKRFHFQK